MEGNTSTDDRNYISFTLTDNLQKRNKAHHRKQIFVDRPTYKTK